MLRNRAMWRRPRIAIVSATAVAMAAIALAPAVASGDGRIVADSGFRPVSDGYSFQNYGSGYQGLTSFQMRRLFGNAVCAGPPSEGGGCALTPSASQWMGDANQSMGGGHCYGFASTSLFWFLGIGNPPTPAPFGSTTTPGLELVGNTRLQSHIAYAFVLQALNRVQQTEIAARPSVVLERLRNDLRHGGTRYIIAISQGHEGHAVNPYAIKRLSRNRWRILIYDNNHPMVTRRIRVNTRHETWRYGLFPGTVWHGNARTKSLDLSRPSAGLGPQPWPQTFPGSQGSGAALLTC
jgi:hypothetical protein